MRMIKYNNDSNIKWIISEVPDEEVMISDGRPYICSMCKDDNYPSCKKWCPLPKDV